jgi:hypothetical protein
MSITKRDAGFLGLGALGMLVLSCATFVYSPRPSVASSASTISALRSIDNKLYQLVSRHPDSMQNSLSSIRDSLETIAESQQTIVRSAGPYVLDGGDVITVPYLDNDKIMIGINGTELKGYNKKKADSSN